MRAISCPAVHPHARGDNARRRCRARLSGSPPRAWGQSLMPGHLTAVRRFTPTRVGTTLLRWILDCCHDRFTPTRVGTTHRTRCPHGRIGSPPRAWGQLIEVAEIGIQGRFTPTRVGTTESIKKDNLRRLRFTPTRVGTMCRSNENAGGMCGSPPRAWGQLRRRTTGHRAPPVHPHARGDNDSGVGGFQSYYGSPPRAWGQCFWNARHRSKSAVHPHARGDNQGRCLDPRCNSVHPHARGDNAEFDLHRAACAVHPHARGDNSYTSIHGWLRCGSPPRAWGQCRYRQRHARRRFTPTRVGTIILEAALAPSGGSPPRAWGQ